MDGNQVAQEILYNKYKKIVKNYILNKYSTYYDIDDDISEILIKIFLNLKDYDENKSQFKSWVINITKNYLIDKWRCKGTFTQSSNNVTFTSSINFDTVALNSFTASNTNTSTVTLNNSTSSCFENCNTVSFISTQISASEFALLDMKYVQGYNYNEIGKEFQITSTTVSNKINYIKTKLKKSIAEDIYD